jgi:hypothetical protein
MEQLALFEEKVYLTPMDLRPKIDSFDSILLEKLKKKVESKCSKHGYVVPGTLKLISRSLGIAEKGHFTSDFVYYIKAQGNVYNPPEGFEVEGEVLRKNKMGFYLILYDAIRVMIPRDLHIGNDDFDSVEVGDRIRVQIKKSRFQVNDSHILCVGQYIGKVTNPALASSQKESEVEVKEQIPVEEKKEEFVTDVKEEEEVEVEEEEDAEEDNESEGEEETDE